MFEKEAKRSFKAFERYWEEDMTKDEIKNRISMALKDPVLQQGFEIICKENAKLKGEVDEQLAETQKRIE